MKETPAPSSENVLSEEDLIASIEKQFSSLSSKSRHKLLRGIGDDAAVMACHSDPFTLCATDMLVEGTHFDRRYTLPQDVGYKAVVSNVSDIVAMGGRPQYITVALGIPPDTLPQDIYALQKGMRLACEAYDVLLAGGDTARAPQWNLCAHIIGCSYETPVYRSGLKDGDVLCLTGDIGRAHVCWQIMEKKRARKREKKARKNI